MNNQDQRIYKFPHVYLVEASAGSGKTYCLARRYLQLLINPQLAPQEIPLESILAITFTNKSTLEMKERILEFLKKIALDCFKDAAEKERIISSFGVDEEAARAKAMLIMERLFRNYNFFQVQTIDSFINAILSGCAFKLDLSASFKTRQNHAEYLAYSLDALIDKAADNEEVLKLFKGFLLHYLFIENNASWFPKQDILKGVEDLFSKDNRFAGNFITSNIDSAQLIVLKRDVLASVRELNKHLPEGTNATFTKSLNSFLQRHKDSFDIDDLSNYFIREEFPLNKGYPLPKEAKALWAKIKKELQKICEVEALSAFNYDIEIFNRLRTELKRISSKEDVLFLESLNKEARSLLDEKSLSLPELYYRLATRFRHFLIDEFQDTSLLQWGNILMMVEEALSTGGSLFYVGDRKQAIYRFRGGEAALFNAVKEQFREYNLIDEVLKVNFRSRCEVVEFNNAVFSQDNLAAFLDKIAQSEKGPVEFAQDSRQLILDIFKDAQQQNKPGLDGGVVKLEVLDIKNREEADEVLQAKSLQIVNDLRARFPLSEIAFLVRTNDEAQQISGWLLEAGIPVESEKTLDIRENPLIKELVSLLYFLNSPIDNVSFASFILGDIFSKTSGIAQKDIQDFIFKAGEQGKGQSVYLYREFRQQFPKVWDAQMEEFFKSVGFVPLYELVISILGKFGVLENFRDYQGFFMRFLELIKEQEEEGVLSISAFLEFFSQAPREKLFVEASQSEAVNILTVHKAKGLEFQAVIVPMLEMNFEARNSLVTDEDKLKLVHLKKRYREFSPLLDKIYSDEYLRNFIDELNNAYVALTRAKDELYIMVNQKNSRGALNLYSLLIPFGSVACGAPVAQKVSRAKQLNAIDIQPAVYKDWISVLKDEFKEQAAIAAREKVKKGEIIHFALSCIGNLHNRDIDAQIKSALQKSQARFAGFAQIKELELQVRALLSKKSLLPYFEVSDGEVFVEIEVVNRSGDTKRIVRLIVGDKEAVILDYKSTRADEQGYIGQVQEYIEIIQGIYPKLKVKGVLLYLDDFSLEEL